MLGNKILLNLPEGKNALVEAGDIRILEGMENRTNKNAPGAKCFIRAASDDGTVSTFLSTDTLDRVLGKIEGKVEGLAPIELTMMVIDDKEERLVLTGGHLVTGAMDSKHEDKDVTTITVRLSPGQQPLTFMVTEPVRTLYERMGGEGNDNDAPEPKKKAPSKSNPKKRKSRKEGSK